MENKSISPQVQKSPEGSFGSYRLNKSSERKSTRRKKLQELNVVKKSTGR
jgi:hypothetical protein